MTDPVDVVLVGLGGYGVCYLEELARRRDRSNFRLVAGVDPYPQTRANLAQHGFEGVPVFRDLAGFAAATRADLAIISTPIQTHAALTCEALELGCHVLCEKPVAARIQDALRMQAARDRTGRHVMIGYQLASSAVVRDVKRLLVEGRYGAPKRFRTLHLWPRYAPYYARTDWAGCRRNRHGDWVLDSPANNAMAHDLFLMLFLLGPALDQAAQLRSVQAELYRAKPIDNYDTAAMRLRTDSGAEALFYVSHSSTRRIGPRLSLECERGTLGMAIDEPPLRRFYFDRPDGERDEVGTYDPFDFRKIDQAIEMARTGEKPVCGLEAGIAQVLAINAAQESTDPVVDLPADLVEQREDVEQGQLICAPAIDACLTDAFEAGLMPSERAVDWARPGRLIDVAEYAEFPARALVP